MTDLETRLADALRDAGRRAPHAGDLVAPARARLRRRRTTAAVVAAVVAVVAIPVGVQLAQQSTEPDVATVVPDGWRTESYRDLTLRVPVTWEIGVMNNWCTQGRRSPQEVTPRVTRPGMSADLILCHPMSGYGVKFGPGVAGEPIDPSSVPDGAFWAEVETPEATALIVAETQEQLQQIQASVAIVEDVDPNGCATKPWVSDPHSDQEASVCRYDSGWLAQSQRLDSDETDALRRALFAAPEITPPDQEVAELCEETVENDFVAVVIDGGEVLVDLEGECGAPRAYYNGHVVVATQEIRRWTDMLAS